jgi:hypothetical protein
MNMSESLGAPVSSSELLATAAHLHVQMRRLIGRVTDTEWIVASPDYARAMIKLAKEKAAEDNLPTLLQTAQRLELQLRPLTPPASTRAAPIAPAPAPAHEPSPEGGLSAAAQQLAQRYVGRLR